MELSILFSLSLYRQTLSILVLFLLDIKLLDGLIEHTVHPVYKPLSDAGILL